MRNLGGQIIREDEENNGYLWGDHIFTAIVMKQILLQALVFAVVTLIVVRIVDVVLWKMPWGEVLSLATLILFVVLFIAGIVSFYFVDRKHKKRP